MWKLSATNAERKFEAVGTFPSAVEAASQIVKDEGYSVTGVVFEVLLETDPVIADADRQLSYLVHQGKRSRRLYVLEQIAH